MHYIDSVHCTRYRRTGLIVLFCFLLTVQGYAEGLSLSGTGTTSLYAAFDADGGAVFDSPLNPGNLLDLHPLGTVSDISFHLESSGDNDAFTLWTSLKSYPVGSALSAAAYGDVTQELMIGNITASYGDTLITLSIDRLNYLWYVNDTLRLVFGRQSLLTGYGYGWNPMDLATPARDPTDPEAQRVGVDALSMLWEGDSALTGELYALSDTDSINGGVSWSDLSFGGEGTLLLPSAEIRLTMQYDCGSSKFNLGAGTYLDISGAGLYGEANMDGDLLAGAEYYFENGSSMIIEYFYHHEGRDLQERREYVTALATELSAETILSFHPGHFARHYILAHLSYPLYDRNTDLSCTVLASPDSGSCMVSPLATFYPSGNLTVFAGYNGIFSLGEELYNEADLSPVRHMVNVGATYAF